MDTTPLSTIPALLAGQRAYFQTGATRALSWRQEQLNNCLKMASENEAEFADALGQDLGKSTTEATLTEILPVILEIKDSLKHVREWMAPEPAASHALCAPAFLEIRKEPRGCTLIIAPFNYPMSLMIGPLLSALAAGDTAIIKPSELCPATAALVASLVPQYFQPEVVSVVSGGIPVTTALMEQQWDLVFFTGSDRVGKIIAGAAAKTLSPVVLELGGKSPLVVDEACPEMSAMCDRIVWGKTVNCGALGVTVSHRVQPRLWESANHHEPL